MTALPRSALWSAAVVLTAIAVLGVYLGVNRGVPGPGDYSSQTYVAARTSASGRPAMAEPPPPSPALDEGAIRKIAREEAEAALTRGRTTSAAHRPARSESNADATGSDTADPSSDSSGDAASGSPTRPSAPSAAAAAAPSPAPPAGPPD